MTFNIQPNTKHKAFSITELSIVIVIIGILVAGLIGAQKLVYNFKVKTAQKITLSSDVSSINDLALWLETSLSDSLVIDYSNNEITRWKDINPQALDETIDAYDTTQSLPTYSEKMVNNLPAVIFKDSAKNILINPDDRALQFLSGSNYTIFVVEQRLVSGKINGENGIFLGSDSSDTDHGLKFGYDASSFNAGNQGRNWNISVPFSEALIPRIHILKYSDSAGKSYDMKSKTEDSYRSQNSSATDPIISYSDAVIGGSQGSTDLALAEIIIFKRALKKSEITSVEEYLAKKYGIALN